VKSALWDARDKKFADLEAVDAFLDTLPHSARGTYRANTSCLQIEADTEEYIICDAGTGLRDLSQHLGSDPAPATYHIFISHLHWDHIQGFPFFAPAYKPDNRIVFHGFHESIEKIIRQQMDAPCFPVSFEAMQAKIEFDIRENGASFDVGDVHVSTIMQQHPGDSWGYRFDKNGKRIVYSSDSEHGPEAKEPNYRFIQFFEDADVLIFDGQYTVEEATNEKKHWGHSDHMTAVEIAARAKVEHLIIFHHEPAYSDADIEAIHHDSLRYCKTYNEEALGNDPEAQHPKRISLAYDGLTVEA
jgi:phosphoribosyl 1,2-cyclic phosphodiesterase